MSNGETMKPSKRFFLIAVAAILVVFVAYGILRMKFGPLLPTVIDKNLPDALIFICVGMMLWNRKLRSDEGKAAADKKRADDEAAAAKPVEAVSLDEASTEGMGSAKGEAGAGGSDAGG